MGTPHPELGQIKKKKNLYVKGNSKEKQKEMNQKKSRSIQVGKIWTYL